MTKKRLWHFDLLGIIFIFLGLLSIADSLYTGRTFDIFWFCIIGMVIIGIGMLMKNPTIIESQLLILIIPDIFWSIDFISHAVTGNGVFGFTNWVFEEGPLMPRLITLQHILMIPIAIHSIAHFQFKNNKAWAFSIVQVLTYFFITRSFTSPENNINCVYTLCGEKLAAAAYYPIIWIGGSICMILLTRLFFLSLERRIAKKSTLRA